MMPEEKRGPLAGVRLLDLTSVFMGPAAAQMLGDFGADVIKIEGPAGDIVRGVGPRGERGMGPLFLNVNRNKRSLVLDLKAEAGREALLALAKSADVLLYNVRPAAMERLRLAYADLHAVNPRIIYVGAFGFSRRGPYAPEAAYDDAIQAAVALPAAAMANGSAVPRYAPVTMADRAVGIYAMGVVCAALFARERTGVGQSVDVPMFETMTQFVFADHLYGQTFIPAEGDFGYPRVLNPHRRPYATLDGFVCAVVYTDEQWKRFLGLIGREELFETDPRFATIVARTANVEALYEFLAATLATRTTEEWRASLRPLDIPVFPMNTFESLLSDPHLAEIGFFEASEHPSEGRIRTMACPSEWSQTPASIRRHAPRLGEHSREVLAEAGYSSTRIDALIAAGITRQA